MDRWFGLWKYPKMDELEFRGCCSRKNCFSRLDPCQRDIWGFFQWVGDLFEASFSKICYFPYWSRTSFVESGKSIFFWLSFLQHRDHWFHSLVYSLTFSQKCKHDLPFADSLSCLILSQFFDTELLLVLFWTSDRRYRWDSLKTRLRWWQVGCRYWHHYPHRPDNRPRLRKSTERWRVEYRTWIGRTWVRLVRNL